MDAEVKSAFETAAGVFADLGACIEPVAVPILDVAAGLVFIFFYAVMGLFMGTLVDRMNRTRLIAAGVGLWSGLTALSGMAYNFVSLALPRAFIGVGESVLTPAAMSLFGDRYPSGWLGVATAIYGLGVPIGIACSLFIVAYLEPFLGWRGCFYSLGAIGVVLAAAMLFLKETPRAHQRAEPTASTPSFREIIRGLISALRHAPALTVTVLGAVSFSLLLGAAVFEQQGVRRWLRPDRAHANAMPPRINRMKTDGQADAIHACLSDGNG